MRQPRQLPEPPARAQARPNRLEQEPWCRECWAEAPYSATEHLKTALMKRSVALA
jgi:hypothetical protein